MKYLITTILGVLAFSWSIFFWCKQYTPPKAELIRARAYAKCVYVATIESSPTKTIDECNKIQKYENPLP